MADVYEKSSDRLLEAKRLLDGAVGDHEDLSKAYALIALTEQLQAANLLKAMELGLLTKEEKAKAALMISQALWQGKP